MIYIYKINNATRCTYVKQVQKSYLYVHVNIIDNNYPVEFYFTRNLANCRVRVGPVLRARGPVRPLNIGRVCPENKPSSSRAHV